MHKLLIGGFQRFVLLLCFDIDQGKQAAVHGQNQIPDAVNRKADNFVHIQISHMVLFFRNVID